MNGLSCGEESMTIYSAVLIQYQRVTADRQTDVQPISITCFSIADARKNCFIDARRDGDNLHPPSVRQLKQTDTQN